MYTHYRHSFYLGTGLVPRCRGAPLRPGASARGALGRKSGDDRRKLEAVRTFLAAYGRPAATSFTDVVQQPLGAIAPRTGGATDKRPLHTFTVYGQSVIRAALAVMDMAGGEIVPIGTLADLIQESGREIRGVEKKNALSALLARCDEVENEGRRGWRRSKKNGAAEAAPDAEGVATPSTDNRPRLSAVG